MVAVRTKNVKTSQFAQHYIDCHPDPDAPDMSLPPLFNVKAIDHSKPNVKRKIREAIAIDELKPTQNRRHEDNGKNDLFGYV